MFPLVDNDTLEKYYSKTYEYFDYQKSSRKILESLSGYISNSFFKPARARSYLKWIKRNIAFEPANILEIGTGNGFFLEKCKQEISSKCELNAIEASEGLRDILTQKKIKVIAPKIEDALDEYKNSFDLIVLFQVLEHVNNPVTFLKKISVLLSEKGSILIEIPNSPFLNPRWTNLSPCLLKAHFDNEHLLFFSSGSLTKTCELSNLKVLKSSSIKIRKTSLFNKADINNIHPTKFMNLLDLTKSIIKGTELSLRVLLGQDLFGDYELDKWHKENNFPRVIVSKR